MKKRYILIRGNDCWQSFFFSSSHYYPIWDFLPPLKRHFPSFLFNRSIDRSIDQSINRTGRHQNRGREEKSMSHACLASHPYTNMHTHTHNETNQGERRHMWVMSIKASIDDWCWIDGKCSNRRFKSQFQFSLQLFCILLLLLLSPMLYYNTCYLPVCCTIIIIIIIITQGNIMRTRKRERERETKKHNNNRWLTGWLAGWDWFVGCLFVVLRSDSSMFTRKIEKIRGIKGCSQQCAGLS